MYKVIRSQAPQILKFVSSDRHELDMIFDFDIVTVGGHLRLPKHETYKPPLTEIKAALAKTQRLSAGTDAWATVFGENHDNGRSVSRYATDVPEFRERAAKLLALLLATLSGTLFVYQGQEIGTYNMPLDWIPQELKDVEVLKYWDEVNKRYPNDKDLLKRAKAGIQLLGRDNARLPVQWDSSENAGFSTGKPWIRVHDDYKNVNVQKQVEKGASSVLAFWKRVIQLRKKHADVFVHGAFEMKGFDNEEIFSYVKTENGGGRKACVVLNFTEKKQKVSLPEGMQGAELTLGNYDKKGEELDAWEGRVYMTK